MKFKDFAKLLNDNGFNIEWKADDPTGLYIFYGNTLCGVIDRCTVGDYSIVNMKNVQDRDIKKTLQNTIFEYSLTPTNDREECKVKIQFGG